MPLITVIMPAYNSSKYISMAISSILWQSVKDWKILVVDDGSTDGTVEIVDSLISKHPGKISLIRQNRAGPSAARQMGISSADSKYIALMDSDDISFPNRFKRQLDLVSVGNVELCGANIITFGSAFPRIISYPNSTVGIDTLCLFNSPLANPCAFGTIDSFHHAKINTHMYPAEDYKAWIEVRSKGINIGNVNSVLLAYRKHKQQISTARRELQISQRTISAKKFWRYKFGFEPGISTFHKFEKYSDAEELVDCISRSGYSFDRKVLGRQIFAMIMRSSIDSAPLVNIFESKGISLGGYQKFIISAADIGGYVAK